MSWQQFRLAETVAVDTPVLPPKSREKKPARRLLVELETLGKAAETLRRACDLG